MDNLTTLERRIKHLVGNHKHYDLALNITKEKHQKILDELTPAIMANATPEQICDLTANIYNDTAKTYHQTPHNIGIIDELIEFMYMIDPKGEVLDIGCGSGRDALFLTTPNSQYRHSQMLRETNGVATIDRYTTPTLVLKTHAVDTSAGMIDFLKQERDRTTELGRNEKNLTLEWADLSKMSEAKRYKKRFAGIWSCTSLLTHTPQCRVIETVQSAATMLAPGGTLFLSYTAREPHQPYDKFIVSSTERYKHFSHQVPSEIAAIATHFGLTLKKQTMSNFEVKGKIIAKNLFANQFFIKE